MRHEAGARPGAGRKAGGRNKATIEREIRTTHGIAAVRATDVLPLDIMLAVAGGGEAADKITDRQLQAAIATAPYLHPRLSAVAFQEQPIPSQIDLSVLTSEERHLLLDMLRKGVIRADGSTRGAADGAALIDGP